MRGWRPVTCQPKLLAPTRQRRVRGIQLRHGLLWCGSGRNKDCMVQRAGNLQLHRTVAMRMSLLREHGLLLCGFAGKRVLSRGNCLLGDLVENNLNQRGVTAYLPCGLESYVVFGSTLTAGGSRPRPEKKQLRTKYRVNPRTSNSVCPHIARTGSCGSALKPGKKRKVCPNGRI